MLVGAIEDEMLRVVSPAFSYYQSAIGLPGEIYLPFVAFALFYAVGRVRLVLDRDYIALALSILLGCFIVELPIDLTLFSYGNGSGYTTLGILVQDVGNAVASSVLYAFIGFSAVLLSYLRRL